MTKAKAFKPSKTTVAFLNYLAGKNEMPLCAIGTQNNIMEREGLITWVKLPAGNYKRELTDKGREFTK